MRRTVLALSVVVALAYGGVRVGAHHAFAATYLEDDAMTIEGELVQITYRNPHSFLHVLVRDSAGRDQRWAVEWGSSVEIRRHESAAETLQIGDHLIVNGSPGRDPSAHRLRMRNMVRPRDGRRWVSGR
jgi:Family of unknown function (DUF6152)